MASFIFIACIPASIIFILLIRKSTANWPFKLIGSILLGALVLLVFVSLWYSYAASHNGG